MKSQLVQIAPFKPDRRTFLKTLGVVGAASGLSACENPERILPRLVPDARSDPGRAQQFSTVCRECPAGCGMMVRVNSGRPTKVEGNPDHPVNHGKLCLRGQTAVQGLYNPDRLRQPMMRDQHGVFRPADWETAMARWRQALEAAPAGSLAWLGQLESGSLAVLIREWMAARQAPPPLFYEYFSYDYLKRGFELTHRRAVVPTYHLERARYLISFGAEFLETWVSNVEFAGQFTAMHSFGHTKTPARTVTVAPRVSLTGANADEYWPAAPGTEALLAWGLLGEVERQLGGGAPPAPAGVVRPGLGLDQVAARSGVAANVINRAAGRLIAHRPSLVMGPGYTTDNHGAVSCQVAVNLLNDLLGNTGTTVLPDVPHALSATATQAEVYALFQRALAGEVRMLMLHHANPIFHHPQWAEALLKIPFKVSFASWMDETTQYADLLLPDHHFLESWGDYAPRAGVTGLIQPTRVPLYDTRQTGDLLLQTLPPIAAAAASATPPGAALAARAAARPPSPAAPDAAAAAAVSGDLPPADVAGGAQTTASMDRFGAWLRHCWEGPLGGEPHWNAALQRGLSSLIPPGGAVGEPSPAAPARTPPPVVSAEAGYEGDGDLYLVVFPTVQLFDGRQANRSWAQEIAEPLSKIAWDGWCELHTDTATRLQIAPNQVVRIASPHGSIELPLYVSNWIRKDCIGVVLGQGHTNFGMFANGAGDAVFKLLDAAPGADGVWHAQTVKVRLQKLAVRRDLANLQTVKLQQDKRVALAIEVAKADSPAAKETVAGLSFYHYHHTYDTHRWGMAIDLSSCIGCNACQAACYAENNIAVWGRSSCRSHREMTWIRVEMFEGDQAHPSTAMNPDIRFIPVPCQQCGNAPCEYVCPVFAAYHTDEGLNAQVYNRCVGTRYCSNNCIYKVRRFNWYTPQWPEPLNQQLNPTVTVRAKGVMEKCTFCVQRIEAVELDARMNHTEVRDGDIQTACMQTCPTQAIAFGDLLDPESMVSKLAAQDRAYGMFAEENCYPAVSYLKRTKFELNQAPSRPGEEQG